MTDNKLNYSKMSKEELATLQILLDRYIQEVKGSAYKTAVWIIGDIENKVYYSD